MQKKVYSCDRCAREYPPQSTALPVPVGALAIEMSVSHSVSLSGRAVSLSEMELCDECLFDFLARVETFMESADFLREVRILPEYSEYDPLSRKHNAEQN